MKYCTVGIYLVWLYQNNTNPIQIYFYDIPVSIDNMSLMNWLSTLSNRSMGLIVDSITQKIEIPSNAYM